MIKCGECIYCVNQKNTPSNTDRECHYNPPNANGFPRVQTTREGCRLGEKGQKVAELVKAVKEPPKDVIGEMSEENPLAREIKKKRGRPRKTT